MVGRVVGHSGSTVSVEVRGGDGVRTLHDVLVLQPIPGAKMLPPIGASCRVSPEGAEYAVDGYFVDEDPQTQQDFENEQLMGGDFCITTAEGSVLGFYKGGLLVLKANAATGVSASDSGVVNMFGRVIGVLNSLFNLIIQETALGCQTEMSASRALDGAAVIDMKFDAGLGKLETKLNHLKTLKVSINKENLTLPIEGGTAIDISGLSQTGIPFGLSICPVTGNITINTLGAINLQGTLVSLGLAPLGNIVTSAVICPATGLPHLFTSPCRA